MQAEPGQGEAKLCQRGLSSGVFLRGLRKAHYYPVQSVDLVVFRMMDLHVDQENAISLCL